MIGCCKLTIFREFNPSATFNRIHTVDHTTYQPLLCHSGPSGIIEYSYKYKHSALSETTMED